MYFFIIKKLLNKINFKKKLIIILNKLYINLKIKKLLISKIVFIINKIYKLIYKLISN